MDNPPVEVGVGSTVGVINITAIKASGVKLDDPLPPVGVGVPAIDVLIFPTSGVTVPSVGVVPVPGVLFGAPVPSGVLCPIGVGVDVAVCALTTRV